MELKLKSEVYDFLKKLAMLYLPAAGTLYFAVAGIWHLPSAEQVTGTIVAFDTFLGVALGISSSTYHNSPTSDKYEGAMEVNQNEEGTKVISLALNADPEDFEKMDSVRFKVVNNVPPAVSVPPTPAPVVAP